MSDSRFERAAGGGGGRGLRLFVAFEVPEPVRREVRRRLAGLRDRLPRARWVDLEVVHLTLLFLGEVAPEKADELCAALARAAEGFAPLALRLGRGGTFPPGRAARVAWLGVEAAPEPAGRSEPAGRAEPSGPSGPLGIVELHAALRDAAESVLGAEALRDERHPFRPHVTLARCPSPWRRDSVEKFVAAFPGEIGQPFVADAASLIESRLSPHGPRYRTLADLPLAAELPLAAVEA